MEQFADVFLNIIVLSLNQDELLSEVLGATCRPKNLIETGLGLPQGCGDVTDIIGVSAIENV
jgi:hypothetical protein